MNTSRRLKVLMIIPGMTSVVFIGLCVVYYFALNFEDVANVSIKLASTVDNDRAKLICGVSLVTLSATLLWNLVIAVLILFSSTSHAKVKTKLLLWGILTALVVIGSVFIYNASPDQAAGYSFVSAIKQSHSAIQPITNANNALAYATLLSIIVACCALVSPWELRNLKILGKRVQSFLLLLYSNAALLAAGIFEMYALYTWGARLSGENIATVSSLASTLAMSAGALFSLLLLVVYVPIAIIQNNWLNESYTIMAGEGEEADKKKWLFSHGIPGSPLAIFRSYAAMSAPLIAGIITKVLTT